MKQNTASLKNVDFIGRGYDFLKIDPLDLGDPGATKLPVFHINPNNMKLIPDGSASIPRGTVYTSSAGGNFSFETKMLYSAYDFQTAYSGSVSANIGVPGLFSFSSSQSYKKFKQVTGSTENLETYSKVELYDHIVEIIPDYPGEKLDLHPIFIDRVKELPSAYSDDNEHKFLTFIETFGTHYSKKVIFGGRASQAIRISKESYSKLTKENIDLSRGAEGTFKGITAGGSIGLSWEKQEKFNTETKSGQETIRFCGGTPNRNLNDFLKSIKDDPAPICLNLVTLDELLINRYFSDDPDIDEKRNALKSAIINYSKKCGESNENFSSNSLLFYGSNGNQYDTGDKPTIASLNNDTVIEIHNGGGNNNLYYRIGKINSNTISWLGKYGKEYDTGDRPSIAVLEDSTVVEVHNGGGNNNLYYQIGKIESGVISWKTKGGRKYDTGDRPSIALLDDKTVVEVHNGGGNNNLYYRIGKLENNAILWKTKGGQKYDTGDRPSISVLDDKTIIEVHNGGGNNNLYYRIGKVENDKLRWLTGSSGIKYDTGDNPSIATIGKKTVIEIHNGGGNNNLYYRIGKVINNEIIWVDSKGVKYDTGNRPSCVLLNNGTLIDIHNGGGNNNLYYRIGKMF